MICRGRAKKCVDIAVCGAFREDHSRRDTHLRHSAADSRSVELMSDRYLAAQIGPGLARNKALGPWLVPARSCRRPALAKPVPRAVTPRERDGAAITRTIAALI